MGSDRSPLARPATGTVVRVTVVLGAAVVALAFTTPAAADTRVIPDPADTAGPQASQVVTLAVTVCASACPCPTRCAPSSNAMTVR